MNFEELRMSWRQQDDSSALAIDADALFASVRRKSDLLDKQVRWMEMAFLASNFAVPPLLLLDLWWNGVLSGQGSTYQWLLAIALAAICLRLGVYTWRRRRWRQANLSAIGKSMLDHAQQALMQVDYYLKNASDLIGFYLIPLVTVSVVNLTFFRNEVTPWIWIAALGLSMFSIWETRRDIRERIVPERDNLAYLRDRLLTED